ncbi:hypothetical protein [Kineothrix sedimenti]|uniref:Uncharacterized protein n=1 Tax=Kineothrix sedimenti TaxID=3123317 RepID=A0ABZ3F2F6_9FIRM
MGDKTRDKEELAKLLEEKEFNIGQAMKICAEDMDLYIEVLKRGSYRGIRGVGCFSSERFRTVGERNKIKRRVLELSVFSAILFLIKMIKIKG